MMPTPIGSVMVKSADTKWDYYVPEPDLPIEQGTVIAVSFADGIRADRWFVLQGAHWWNCTNGNALEPYKLQSEISSWKLISKPVS